MAYDVNTDTKEEITSLSFSSRTTRTAKITVLPAWAYGICSALFSMLAIGGLFLGFLTDLTTIGRVIADRSAIYSDSLFGIMVEVLRGSISAPALGAGGLSSLPFTLYCLIYFLIAAVVLSLIFTILALVTPRSSKKFCLFNGQLVLLTYGALFVLSALYVSNTDGVYSEAAIDLSTAVILLVCVFLLFLLSCIQRKGRAVTDLLLYIFALLSLFALVYPATELCADLDGLLSGKNTLETGAAVSLGLLFALTVFNLVVGVFRLNAGKAFVFDLVRFGLQTAAVLSFVAASFLQDGSYDVVTDQLLPVILLIAAPFAAFCTAAFTISLISKKKS